MYRKGGRQRQQNSKTRGTTSERRSVGPDESTAVVCDLGGHDQNVNENEMKQHKQGMPLELS